MNPSPAGYDQSSAASPDRPGIRGAEDPLDAAARSAHRVRPDDAMAEALRKILWVQFRIMLDHEAGSRSGEDMEDVHDMRVATRRMRAAFRLFGTYFRPKAVRRLTKDLRRTGRTLGAVRDLDVFNKLAAGYLSTLSPEHGEDLAPLLAHWHDQREQAGEALNAYLDGDRYRRFVAGFGAFVETEGSGVKALKPDEPPRYQVRHVLSSSIWRLYENVRCYETVLAGAPTQTLHALRIECKHLRYTLEFFADVLGSGNGRLVRDVIFVQDHLGDLQDAVVTGALLTEFLAARQDAGPSGDLEGLRAYLIHQQRESARLVASFPQVWPRINGPDFRSRLAKALLAL